jgi:hypothetical protein
MTYRAGLDSPRPRPCCLCHYRIFGATAPHGSLYFLINRFLIQKMPATTSRSLATTLTRWR